jgi:hypothetical protein
VAALPAVHTLTIIRAQSHSYKHTSLASLVVMFYELRFDGALGRPLRLHEVAKLLLFRQ